MEITRNSDVIAADVMDALVLLDPATWTYAHFNDTAATIWHVLETPQTLDSLVAAVLADYEVGDAECRAEVTDFVRGMGAAGFLIVDEDA